MTHAITRGNRFRFVFAGWWVVWIWVHAWVLLSYGAAPLQGFTDALLCNILLAGACLLITNNMKYYLPQRERYWYILILGMVLSLIWLFISQTILKLLFRNADTYITLLNNSSTIRFVIGFLMLGAMAIMSMLWYTLQEQQEANNRKEAAEKMTKDAELFKLRQQLQPHFLFNSLNSISALAGSQPEKARHMIHQLSDFLRGTLKREEQQWVTLDEELHHLGLYLEIEKVRFGHRLQTATGVADDARQLHIPALLLQPVVENAIKFGLYDTTDEVLIAINAEKDDNELRIIISNPYDEETAVSTLGTGFGLASIQRRLFLLFARHDLLQTHKANSIFTTTLIIPQYHYEGNHY